MAAFIRTAFISLVLCGLAWLGYRQWLFDEQARQNQELKALNEQLQEQLNERKEMIERLSRSRRIAHVQVTDQQIDQTGAIANTSLLFIELDENGTEIGRQTFTVPGELVYIDGWTVKFAADDVAQGDPLHGRTLLLLRKIYSDQMPPKDGFAIDTPGAIPPAYAASDIGHFEKQIWQNFWKIATDAELAKQMNVRVAQGEAVYKPMRTGQMFELTIDAVGGMNLMPISKGSDDALTKASAKTE